MADAASCQSENKGYLVWWKQSQRMHTLVTIWAFPLVLRSGIDGFLVTLTLRADEGAVVGRWIQRLNADGCLFLDSRDQRFATPESINHNSDGTLTIEVRSVVAERHVVEPTALHVIVDWFSEAGDLVTLHNDQMMSPGACMIELTEVVVEESADESNALVLVNGPSTQRANSISVSVINSRDEVRHFAWANELPPFKVLRVALADHVHKICEFAGGKPLLVCGEIELQGVWLRPHVLSQRTRMSAYHAGNRYHWKGQPALAYQFMGGGELNPMFVICNREMITLVNVLNTHGDLEMDFWVDAWLYNESGALAAHRPRWLQARRNAVSQGRIDELVDLQAGASFIGHIALRFSNCDATHYPGRLQALLEYRTQSSVSRVMAWSDIWNWRERRDHTPTIRWTSYYRVWCQWPRSSWIAITNCGLDDDYSYCAVVTLHLHNGRGDTLAWYGSVPPQGTLYQCVEYFFPNHNDWLDGQPWALVVAESTSDLAIVCVSTDCTSNVYAVEHFLPVGARDGSDWVNPSGS